MGKHSEKLQKKSDDKEQKNRTKVRKSGESPESSKKHADTSLTAETPFLPRMKEHADILAGIQFTAQRNDFIMRLNNTYGYRYVQRLMKSVKVQAKLKVSQPNDIYEQEADKVADTVTKSLQSQAQRQTPEEEELIQGKLDIERQTPEEEEELQMQENEGPAMGVSDNVEKRINSARGSGYSLSDEVRNPMEQAFGADFSGVRTHTDSEADALNQQLSARAFTTGNDIFFKDGEYNPESTEGKELLAHELTHTRQQGASKRIASWWPKGHREITGKVLNDDEVLGIAYQEDVKKYLEARSPDFDYIQDETTAMEKGRNESKPKIDDLKKIINKGKKATPEEKAKAEKMWDDNQLHIRPQWYMMHHGEGGFYQEDAATGVARNSEVTDQLVNLAAQLYNAGKREAGLSILSDALHQAEDRGSHEEGQMFRGHDIRRTIPPKYIPKGAGWQPPLGYYEEKKDPDNAEVNREGAVKALYFAKDVLTRFIGKLNSFEVEISLKSPKEQPETGLRHSKMGGIVTVTSPEWRTKTKGHTGEKNIRGIKAEEWQSVKEPKAGIFTPEEQKKRQELVEKATHNYVVEWLTSEMMELLRKHVAGLPEKERKLSDQDLIELGLGFLVDLRMSYPEMIQYLTMDEQFRLVGRAVMNYKYQFGGLGERHAGAKAPEVLED